MADPIDAVSKTIPCRFKPSSDSPFQPLPRDRTVFSDALSMSDHQADIVQRRRVPLISGHPKPTHSLSVVLGSTPLVLIQDSDVVLSG
jgi:hypothetical protein